MKEYDKKRNPWLQNIYIDTNNDGADEYIDSVRRKNHGDSIK